MPRTKITHDDVAAFHAQEAKNKRDLVTLAKKQLRILDQERDHMIREFDERQAHHLQFIEDDKRFHTERLRNHEDKKEGVAALVLKLENELDGALDVDETTGAIVQILPPTQKLEIRDPEKKPNRFLKMLKLA